MYLLSRGHSSEKKLLDEKSARNQSQVQLEATIIKIKSLRNDLAHGMETRFKRNDELGYS
jgi:hypothetical protein